MKNLKRTIATVLAMLLLLTCAPTGMLSVSAANEYAMFPMTHLNISQGVNGSFSHQGTQALDLTGKDGGIDSAYAPFTGVVKKIYKGYTVWLESCNPVIYADGTVDYMTIMVLHDNDTSDLYVGKVINQGQRFFEEGTAGYATGNHIHLECGRGKFSGSGWYQNSQGNWMINNTILPYNALHLSSSTVVTNGYGYNWRRVNSHTHSFSAATCTSPKKCSCGATEGAALGHTYSNACDMRCNRCDQVTRSTNHRWAPADCTTPATCYICFVTNGTELGHKYTNACDTSCDRCGKKRTAPHSCAKLSITMQPQTAYAKKGAYVSTKVMAAGEGLSYAWYVSDVGDTKYFLSSQKTNVYKMKVTAENNNRKAYCVITDKHGAKVTSNVAYLRMKAAITAQPKTAYAKKGAYVTTKVTATGVGLTYTWYVKDTGDSKYFVSSQKTNTYKMKVDATNNGRKAYCVVKDTYGNTVKSNVVSLRMKVAITTQPKSVTVRKNSYAKTTVKATGVGLKYVWYVKNAGTSQYVRSSVTSSTYTIKMTSKVNGRRLICRVYDKYGNAVQSNTVILKMK